MDAICKCTMFQESQGDGATAGWLQGGDVVQEPNRGENWLDEHNLCGEITEYYYTYPGWLRTPLYTTQPSALFSQLSWYCSVVLYSISISFDLPCMKHCRQARGTVQIQVARPSSRIVVKAWLELG